MNEDKCPYCHVGIKVTKDSIGKIVHCHNCHNSVFIPRDYNGKLGEIKNKYVQKTAQNLGFSLVHPYKECPHCHRRILEVADRCKFCHASLIDENKTVHNAKEIPSHNLEKVHTLIISALITFAILVLVAMAWASRH